MNTAETFKEILSVIAMDDQLEQHENGDDETPGYDYCSDVMPTTEELFANLPTEGYVFVGILSLFTLLTIAIFLEEIAFFYKHFPHPARTLLVIACFPVFSLTALLGVIIPKSGAVVDLIANGFFGSCMYNFGGLMTSYMGGTIRMWMDVKPDRKISFNVMPCCCCCPCLPKPDLRQPAYTRVQLLILQAAVVRPLLSLLALVLWTNGNYYPGKFHARNANGYILIINMVSTMLAVYGLMVTKVTLTPDLGVSHQLSGKILSFQLALVSSVIPNIIIGILVNNNVIRCGPIFPSDARGEEIYHAVLVLLMFPCALVGQKFFRRETDGQRKPTTTNVLKNGLGQELTTNTVHETVIGTLQTIHFFQADDFSA